MRRKIKILASLLLSLSAYSCGTVGVSHLERPPRIAVCTADYEKQRIRCVESYTGEHVSPTHISQVDNFILTPIDDWAALMSFCKR